MEQGSKPQRLCSEIQLFDLCDLDVCSHRTGRYCTRSEILARFEAIHDVEDRAPEQLFAEELDDVEGAGDLGYDDAFGVDEYGDEEADDDW